MNPAKCSFGVSIGNFLRFLVHHRSIEVDENKARAIIDAPHPTTKKQLQSLLGKINFLRCFIANSTAKMTSLSGLKNIERLSHKSRLLLRLRLSSYHLGVINPLSFTFRWPKNPSAASLHKILMLGVNKLFSISADTSTLQRSIIRLSKNLVWLCSSPQQNFGIIYSHPLRRSSPR
ncbi:hypothetical protein ACFX15_012762 [Malus domestica]